MDRAAMHHARRSGAKVTEADFTGDRPGEARALPVLEDVGTEEYRSRIRDLIELIIELITENTAIATAPKAHVARE